MNKHYHYLKQGRAGFSLLEILVAVMLVLVLVGLVLLSVGRLAERSGGIDCIARLRTISGLFHAYAASENMKVLFTRDGSGTRLWYNELKNYAGYGDEEVREMFRCPSLKMANIPAGMDGWYCYGFRLDYAIPTHLDPGVLYRDGATGFYELNLSRVENPSTFFIMSDTVSVSGGNIRQVMRIIPRNGGIYAGTEGIHLRHQNRANVLFLDGHIETMDRQQLAHIAIRQAFDSNNQMVSSD